MFYYFKLSVTTSRMVVFIKKILTEEKSTEYKYTVNNSLSTHLMLETMYGCASCTAMAPLPS